MVSSTESLTKRWKRKADVMGLFDLFKKKQTNERMDQLTPEGELPWGWLAKNTPICKPYEDKIVQMAIDLKTTKGADKIKRLENLIALYYEYKQFCYSKDECFIKYFADQWEHCHNSRCDDFEYITRFEAELEELKNA